jgi:DNA adenine methylase
LASGCYLEPFAGGAALFFGALPVRALISDVNPDLVELYQVLACDPVALHGELGPLFAAHAQDPKAYYRNRFAWNEDRGSWSAFSRAAMLLYLNRSCYNGLWRVNLAGRMNVPIGRSSSGKPPSCPTMAHLAAASAALRGCRILRADYVDVVAQAVPGDFVYFDPPYEPRSLSASFTSYAPGGFTAAHHDELGAHAVALVARGVRVMVSSADVPGARERYPGFAVHELSAPRSIAARGGGRGRVGELLLTGGYEPRSPGVGA